jgi:hypothetical protein
VRRQREQGVQRIGLWVLLVAGLAVAWGCGRQLEPNRSVRTTARPEDFKAGPSPVLLSPVAPAPAAVHDPDDLLKYVSVRLHRYLSGVSRQSDGRFLLVFKGGREAVDVPTLDDLMGIELVEVEKHSIVLQVRKRTTLRVSLHEARGHEGGVVKIQPLPR